MNRIMRKLYVQAYSWQKKEINMEKLTQQGLINKMKIEFAFNGIKMEVDDKKIIITGKYNYTYNYTLKLIYDLYTGVIADANKFFNEDFENDPIAYMCFVAYPQKAKI